MEYHLLYENSDILTNDDIISVNPNLKSAWDTPSDNSSMDNDEYYEWNSMKIDEDSKLQPENTSTIDKHGKLGKKRKLTGGRESRHSLIDDVQDPLATPKSKQVKKGAGATVMPNGVSRMPPHWPVDDISDIDGSITTLDPNQYNMSDAILSISGLTVFKQEVPSPTSQEVAALKLAQRSSQSPTSTQESPRNVLEDANADQHMINNTINQLLNQTGYGNLQTAFEANLVSPHSSQDSFSVTSTNFNFSEDCRFQYVLAAATSIATKINEDTLTYLNQGQSYEIKLKKLGDLSMYRGKILKSVVRICFHERRLQYMEKEQMALWQRARPGDRILEVDIPLSYGAFEVIQPNNALNVVHFNWDPTKEVGVYIKVNCISTEFTPKKHGGEKGVPFRIQVETYTASENPETAKRLHAAACQIKVFKLKGADRKHKQDRDKIMKRSLTEQEKFQPSYECTVLNDIPNEAVLSSPAIAPILSNDGGLSNKNLSNPISPKINTDPLCTLDQSPSIIAQQKIDHTSENSEENEFRQLTLEGTPKQTELWLRGNRFEKYAQTFACFSGADMLRLSRNDIMQMCGQPDGIRLFNALHAKIIAPRLKIFVSRENSTVFNAIFLTAHCNHELLKKLAAMVGVSHDQVRDIFMEGPQSIHVQLCNDVIRHIKEDSMFHLEIIRDNDAYIFLLKNIMK